MKLLIFIFFSFSINDIYSQEQKIKWTQNKNWNEIIEQAKNENKYIFVDLIASWCQPCKEMEKTTLIDSSVVNYYNANFICIKAPIDSTNLDLNTYNPLGKYGKILSDKYDIKIIPTYLYLDNNGTAVHRFSGYVDAEGFILCGKNAFTTGKQYYNLLKQYESNELDKELIPYLAKLVFNAGYEDLAFDFVNEYYDYKKTHPIGLLTPKTIELFSQFSRSSKDHIFLFLKSHKEEINALMNDQNYFYNICERIIDKEITQPLINEYKKNNIEPEWNTVFKKIMEITDTRTASNKTISAKIEWYLYSKDYKNFSKCSMRQVSHFPYKHPIYYNNAAFAVFQYSNSKIELLKALEWTNYALSISQSQMPIILDTKANILYKLGKRKEAIEIQKNAAHLSSQNEEILDNLNKMIEGKPTWPNLNNLN